MSFWQENYAFIKDVYDMRHQKMAEWMDNVEKVPRRGILSYLTSAVFISHYDGETLEDHIIFLAVEDKRNVSLHLQAISRIMADKVYTSAEFKRERDNFHVSNPERTPTILLSA